MIPVRIETYIYQSVRGNIKLLNLEKKVILLVMNLLLTALGNFISFLQTNYNCIYLIVFIMPFDKILVISFAFVKIIEIN